MKIIRNLIKSLKEVQSEIIPKKLRNKNRTNKDCELEDELLLGEDEGELQDELIEASVMEDELELLLLLDSSLEDVLLDEEEDEIAADQLLLELLLDSE